MRRRLAPEADKCVIRSYFMGLTRDSAAERCGVGGGTVSNIWGELEEKIGPEGRGVRDLAIQLRRLNLTVGEAAKGARINATMESLGIRDEGIEDFTRKVYEASIAKGRSAETVAEAASRLIEIEQRSGLHFEQILKRGEEKAEELRKSQEDLHTTASRLQEAKLEVQSALKEKGTTREALDSYVKARDSLKAYEIDVDQDLGRAANMLSNAKEKQYDMKSLVDEAKARRSLSKENARLTREVESLRKDEQELKKRIEPHLDALSELESLKNQGFTRDRFTALREKIVEICSARGMETRQALAKFFEDLEQYDKKMGWEYELKRLESLAETTRLNLERLKGEQDALERRIKDRKEAASALQSLRKRGVETTHIARWEKILEKANLEPQNLLTELEKYAGIVGAICKKEGELITLEAETEDMGVKLKGLEDNKSKVEASITSIKDAAVEKIEEAAKQVNSLVDAAIEAGRRLGGLEALPPLMNFITKMEGDPPQVHSMFLFVVNRYRSWLDKQPDPHLTLKSKLEQVAEWVPRK